ncbi:MAG: biotin/lipoyl-containing protein, partial [Acidimicrobiales bacterium]
MADILMPQLGETVTEGTSTRWLKSVGDQVAEDEVLFEVSTDKVDSEVPSPAAGVVSKILVAEGETVDVGTKLAVISDSAAGDGSGGGEAAATEEPEAAAEPTPEPATEEPATEEPATEAPEPQATQVSGEGDGDGGAGGGGKVLSPVVRRLIAEHNLDPATITGTGAGGRITRSDVLAVIDQQSAKAKPSAAQPAEPAGGSKTAPPAPAAAAAGGGAHDTVVKFTNIRKRTAEHMVRSKHTSA